MPQKEPGPPLPYNPRGRLGINIHPIPSAHCGRPALQLGSLASGGALESITSEFFILATAAKYFPAVESQKDILFFSDFAPGMDVSDPIHHRNERGFLSLFQTERRRDPHTAPLGSLGKSGHVIVTM